MPIIVVNAYYSLAIGIGTVVYQVTTIFGNPCHDQSFIANGRWFPMMRCVKQLLPFVYALA